LFAKEGSAMSIEGSAMSVVFTPSAREAFTPRELAGAYKDFEKLGPQHPATPEKDATTCIE
jgi:hypothetical protein